MRTAEGSIARKSRSSRLKRRKAKRSNEENDVMDPYVVYTYIYLRSLFIRVSLPFAFVRKLATRPSFRALVQVSMRFAQNQTFENARSRSVINAHHVNAVSSPNLANSRIYGTVTFKNAAVSMSEQPMHDLCVVILTCAFYVATCALDAPRRMSTRRATARSECLLILLWLQTVLCTTSEIHKFT